MHHVFPIDYVSKNPGKNKIDANSLMNIAYLTQITNLEISNQNPLNYIKKFDNPPFVVAMKSHLLPNEILEWSRMDKMPDNALDVFIGKRMELVFDHLQEILSSISIDVIDTRISS